MSELRARIGSSCRRKPRARRSDVPHDLTPGTRYRAPGPGIWVVEAVFEGPATIFADDKRVKPSLIGFALLANRDLNIRVVIRLDDPRLDRLMETITNDF